MSTHEQEVKEFFSKIKTESPEKYNEVCDKYPIVTAQKLKTIRTFEKTCGLIGFEKSKINLGEAMRANVESLQSEE